MFTAVGGYQNLIDTNKLFSVDHGKGQHKEPCPLRKAYTSVLLSEVNLIVADGMQVVTSGAVVEVMNSLTNKWSAAALPKPMWVASAMICCDHIYMLERVDEQTTKDWFLIILFNVHVFDKGPHPIFTPKASLFRNSSLDTYCHNRQAMHGPH